MQKGKQGSKEGKATVFHGTNRLEVIKTARCKNNQLTRHKHGILPFAKKNKRTPIAQRTYFASFASFTEPLAYLAGSYQLTYKFYNMIITKNKVVSVSYVLREGDFGGEVVEQTTSQEPFVFLFGVGSLLPDFENNLLGLKVGDMFKFSIASQNAYGPMESDAIVELPIDIFVIDGAIDYDLLQIGNVVPMRNDQGHLLHGTVVNVTDDVVTMDFNHPMAGKDLYFMGTVLDIREATPTELEHGHVHGPGGHHH